MKSSGNVYVACLKACTMIASLVQGKMIHLKVIGWGLACNATISNNLMSMYAKCGSLEEAEQVFNRLQGRDVVSWNVIISAYARQGYEFPVLQIVKGMQNEGITPEKFTFLSSLKICSNTGSLPQGRIMHVHIILSGVAVDVFIGSSLVNMYAKCGSLQETSQVFERSQGQNAVSWNTIIAAYVQNKDWPFALKLYNMMQHDGIQPEEDTFSIILKACGQLRDIEYGKIVHDQIVKIGVKLGVLVGTSLVDMYARCGCLEEARAVFGKLQHKNVITWGTMIVGYAQHGCSCALELFERMQEEGIKPGEVTVSSILKVCTLEQGKMIHGYVIKHKLISSIINCALVDMYAKSVALEEAKTIFDSKGAASWCSLIAGYSQNGHALHALQLFMEMQQEGIEPEKFTFASVLKSCGSIGAIEKGRQIHSQILIGGVECDAILGNILIDMYVKCGSMGEADKVFETLNSRDEVSWSTMIFGYAQDNHGFHAVQLYQKMLCCGKKPDRVTFLGLLKACGSMGAIEQGRQIHMQLKKCMLKSDIAVCNSLIDMYAKCWNIEEAQIIFDQLADPNVVSWDTLIGGYAQYGNFIMAKKLLDNMECRGVKPNEMTFTSILAACCRAGLVDEGCQYVMLMEKEYGITPNIYHYSCTVDLLGRAGYLNEATRLLQIMEANIRDWTSVLTSCRTYGNVGLARQCFDQVVKSDSHCAVGYVLMSNIFVDANMLEDAEEIERQRKSVYAWKTPGRAWIEVNKKVHEFVVGSN